jgi:(2Fe-2S) ferredoxin
MDSKIISDPAVAAGLKKARVAGARKHLFLCLGPDCCSLKEGTKVWDYLKHRTAELEKELSLEVMRTKAQCFRVCARGPWLVVYPDGVWYGEVTIERCERILAEHIVAGRPVEEWIAARNPLSR